MTRVIALFALTLLAACSPKLEEVAAEPVFVEQEMPAGRSDPACLPGDDDGIGGTGCPVN